MNAVHLVLAAVRRDHELGGRDVEGARDEGHVVVRAEVQGALGDGVGADVLARGTGEAHRSAGR